jgi:hypothetical protein
MAGNVLMIILIVFLSIYLLLILALVGFGVHEFIAMCKDEKEVRENRKKGEERWGK